MSFIGKVLATIVALVIIAFVAGSVFAPGLTSSILSGVVVGQPEAEDAVAVEDDETITGDPYPGNATVEATLVDHEAERLVAVRSAAAAGPSKALDTRSPFRLATEGRATLILPERAEPYDLAGIAALAPDTLAVDETDGTYLLREHLAVMSGAVLRIGAGERLLLAGDESGFSSLVALGGSIRIVGTPESRASVSSWNPVTGGPDELTTDGRPYLRVLGGSLRIESADLSALGFWSGETGGVSFDGRQSPDIELESPAAGSDGAPTVEVSEAPPVDVGLVILDSVVTESAFGLTVAGVEDAVVTDSEFSRNLADGIVLDREVAGATLTRTTASSNGRDGIVVSPTCTSITLTEPAVDDNARNGLVLDGGAVAEGPSTTGAETSVSRGFVVEGGTFGGNARSGIDVLSGANTQISESAVTGGDMGIVLGEGARNVEITANRLEGQARHAISVRDDAVGVTISGNEIASIEIGVYVRNAEAEIRDNEITDASVHGIALTGQVDGSIVTDNRIAGTGPRAIDVERAIDARVEQNYVDGWASSRTLEQILATVMQPLTIVWTLIVTLVIVALVTRLGAGRRRDDPLRDRRPLQSLSRGIVDRPQAGRLQS